MKTIIIVVGIMITVLHSHAQSPNQYPARWSVNASLFTQTTGAYAESVRIPGMNRHLSGGKGVQLGTEYLYIDHKNWQLFQSVSIMQYWHRKQEKGLAVNTALGYRRKIFNAYLEALAGPGYMTTRFHTAKELQKESGEFYSMQHKIAGFTPTVAIGAGYHISQHCKVYLRHYHHGQLQNATAAQAVRLHRTFNVGLSLDL